MNVDVNDEVHARCSDGITYVGVVTQIDTIRLEVEVKFEDGDMFWTRYSDLRLVKKKASSRERCRVCFVKDSTMIVCVECNEAFHQSCHIPPASSTEADNWMCRFCVLSRCATPGGMKNCAIYKSMLKQIRSTLPYDVSTLNWDAGAKTNSDERYCYCGGPGDWNLKMLQCDACLQWFHEACMSCLSKPILNGDLFYVFKCAACSDGTECLQRLPMSWSEALHLIIYNLGLISPARFYRLETDIIRYAKVIWDDLQVHKLDEEAPNWDRKREKIIDVLQSNKSRFQQYEKNGTFLKLWGLFDPDTPPKPSGRRRRKLTNKSSQILKSSVSMSDDAGKIKLKISRSPSEGTMRKPKANSSDEDVFFTNDNGGSSPDCHPITKPVCAKKSETRSNSRGSSILNGSTHSGQSLRKVAKRKSNDKNKKKPSRKRHDSFDSSISSEIFSKPSQYLTDEHAKESSTTSKRKFCLSNMVPERNFFNTEWRMESGEGFRVMGKRVTPDGKISYLIEWEGSNLIV